MYLNQLTKDRHTLSAAIVIILETVFDDLSLNIGKWKHALYEDRLLIKVNDGNWFKLTHPQTKVSIIAQAFENQIK